ncbi:ABC transporter substrate-binding protein [Desulfurococcus mucosus]|uniref:Extracellular solute-binding protein family 1 n=1 Tax=Desulfurococcus mucosus (strain ATCC 35584 / DSM 2162 / JCM 9187 / O7/1) TaxID=765177 RepID=E8R8I3_DESM0|nr:ABC transporter substrate-binding protein [Desulfurococcus mucosus]ADV64809.1 extracellular solute-binding protein family 1 [Desulfurococcus mucosus DSM 2162]
MNRALTTTQALILVLALIVAAIGALVIIRLLPPPQTTTTTTQPATTTTTTTTTTTQPATTTTTTTGKPTYAEYPWLDQLKQLTSERGVKLIVITRHEQSILTATRNAFLNSPVARELGITDIQFVAAPAELWTSYIDNAAKAGTPIDVAWGGGPTLFNNLDAAGYLLPVDPSKPEFNAVMYELNKIPKTIGGAETFKVDGNGLIHWIGASVSSFGFTVNLVRLNQYGLPMPQKWEDLASPQYARYLPDIPQIATADPTMSTSNTRIFEIILQAKGWEEGWRILTLLAANAVIYQGSSDARDAVIRGDVAVGTTIDFYGYMAQQVNPNCKYIAPQGETIVNSDPIALVKTTKHLVHAVAFMAWVLNEYGGQQIWLLQDINRLPVNPKVFETQAGQSRQDLKQALQDAMYSQSIPFNETLSASWVNAVIYYFKATLVNPHDDLKATWARIAQAYLDGKISREWFTYLTKYISKPLSFKDPVTGSTVSFTVDYAISINQKMMSDASVYQALMSQWESLARERYLNALNLLQDALAGKPVPSGP